MLVKDTRGLSINGVNVFMRATPRVTSGDTELTGNDGWATLHLTPNRNFRVRSGYNVQFYIQAYRQGEPLLAGIAGFRLFQVKTRSSAGYGAVGARRASPLQLVAKALERGPPRIEHALDVLVRLGVQVLAAHRAESRAVLAAEDLLGRASAIASRAQSATFSSSSGTYSERRPSAGGASGSWNSRARTSTSSSANARQRMHGPTTCACSRRSNTIAPDALVIWSSAGTVSGWSSYRWPAEQERLHLDVEALVADLSRTEAQAAEIDGVHVFLSVPPARSPA